MPSGAKEGEGKKEKNDVKQIKRKILEKFSEGVNIYKRRNIKTRKVGEGQNWHIEGGENT
jgi:hypothetical protein